MHSFQSITFGRQNEMVVYNNELYFAADNGTQGKELCKVNAQSDLEVLDVLAGTDAIVPRQLVVFNNKIYFVGYDSVHLDELWMSDGTTEGTEMVTEINPNGDVTEINPNGDSFINFPQAAYEPLFIYNDELWFSAWDDAHGRELWYSDGTAAGTERFTDLTDANAGSTPSKFVIHDNKLFFSANYLGEGRQLHSYDAANDELITHWQNGHNDVACCTGKMYSIAGELYMPGNYDFDDEIRDELYKLGSTVSLGDINHINRFIQVFPSPASESFQILTHQMQYPIDVAVINANGQTWQEIQITNPQTTIDVQSLASGIYLIRCKDSSGETQITRWVKE